MQHTRGTLKWDDANKKQVRDILMRNGIASTLWTVGFGLLMGPEWSLGPDIYLIDTLTNKGARVTVQGPEEFDVKVSSRTGEELLDELSELAPALVDRLVVLG